MSKKSLPWPPQSPGLAFGCQMTEDVTCTQKIDLTSQKMTCVLAYRQETGDYVGLESMTWFTSVKQKKRSETQ